MSMEELSNESRRRGPTPQPLQLHHAFSTHAAATISLVGAGPIHGAVGRRVTARFAARALFT
jgi:hypothetical protein